MVYGLIPGQPEQIALPSDRTPGGFIYSFMSANGSISLNTDASGSAITFSFIVPTGRTAHIDRINMVLLDVNQRPSLFGSQPTLTVGCKLISISSILGPETFDFCDDQTITMNADFSLLAGVDVELDSGPADDARYVRWTIAKAGHPLRLESPEGIAMVIQDDLSGMADFRVLVQGVLLPV